MNFSRRHIMHASSLRFSLVLAALAPLTLAAQEAPRVIFCSGQCFAVDDKGVRTPAPKGTQLQPGQRFETGAGGYAQVKIGDTGLGVGEGARVRFDQRSFRDRDVVTLDQGRLRVGGGAAIGKTNGRPIDLRTPDGTLALRGADVELKKTGAGPSTTIMKVNAGDARLGDVPIGTQGIQGLTGGKLVTD